MIFSLLVEPESYLPALWDLRRDAEARAWWIRVFELQLDDMLDLLAARRGPEARLAALPVREKLHAFLGDLDAAALAARPHVHAWTELRDELLRAHGVGDPYQEVKAEENERALELLPGVLQGLRERSDAAAALRLALGGIFAGNIFDLGSPITAREHRDRGVRFTELRDEALRRPWLIDHGRELLAGLDSLPRGSRIVVLVDNAGPDFVCGTLPLAVWLAERGFELVLAANELPTLNDVTAAEGRALLERVAAMDPAIAGLLGSGRLGLVSTGTHSPGIDFREVGARFSEVSRSARLLVLEGQGRALETNWRARFSVPVLRVSTIKDRLVARELHGAVYDVVADYREALAPPRS